MLGRVVWLPRPPRMVPRWVATSALSPRRCRWGGIAPRRGSNMRVALGTPWSCAALALAAAHATALSSAAGQCGGWHQLHPVHSDV
jgi:hypothetical protein